MASIEVSLSSNTPRRKKNGSLTGISIGSSIRSIPKEIASKELENLRNALRDKENIIQSLKGQLTIPGLRLPTSRNGQNATNHLNGNGTTNGGVGAGSGAIATELTEVEKKQAEERLTRLKIDVDNKRLAIKNLKIALEKLDITDNIDVRIQQAELEYQLGREELNLLTLLEETRTLKLCLEESNKNSLESHTLYSCVNGCARVVLVAVELSYDAKNPRFGAGQKDSCPGLWIDWALEETGMCKGDRLVEVNGKLVLTKNRADLMRLIAAAPDPAQIVVLRKLSENSDGELQMRNGRNNANNAEVASLRSELEAVREHADEAQKTKDTLITDNIRLTHRISYLEEQVSELLVARSKVATESVPAIKTPVISTVKSSQNVTNINISSIPSSSTSTSNTINNTNNQEMYQRSRSSMSNVSNTHIRDNQSSEAAYHCHSKSPHRAHKHHRSPRQSSSLQTTVSSLTNGEFRKQHHHHHHHHHNHHPNNSNRDYSSETNSVIGGELKHNHHQYYSSRDAGGTIEDSIEVDDNDNLMDQSYKHATKIVHDLTQSANINSKTRECSTTNLYEKHRQKCITASEKYNTDILRHYNARKSTSVLDFRAVETHAVPDGGNSRWCSYVPDARSVKSLDFDSDCPVVNGGGGSKHQIPIVPKNGGVDYTSEPLENGRSGKPRPTPPKKPLRLSLHKTHSLQSVDSGAESVKNNCDSRKRNYRGECGMRIDHQKHSNGHVKQQLQHHQEVKWTNFGHITRKDYGVEVGGSWC